MYTTVVRIRIRNLVLFCPWIRDGKTGSRMNIPDKFSESLETVFRVKNTWILWCGSGSETRNLFDAGSGIFLTLDSGSRMEKFRSGINIPDPEPWYTRILLLFRVIPVAVYLYEYHAYDVGMMLTGWCWWIRQEWGWMEADNNSVSAPSQFSRHYHCLLRSLHPEGCCRNQSHSFKFWLLWFYLCTTMHVINFAPWKYSYCEAIFWIRDCFWIPKLGPDLIPQNVRKFVERKRQISTSTL